MKREKYPKPKKGAWFVKVRGSYLPISWQGWLMYVPYVALIMMSFIALFDSLASCVTQYDCGQDIVISIILFNVMTLVPFYVALVVIMHWIAKRKF